MRYVLCVIAVAPIALFAFAGVGLADPNLAPDVPKHRHFVVSASGELIPVGPQICVNADLQDAFNQFHYNVHHSFIPMVGPIDTLGPQDGARGLHNGRGGDLVAIPGCP